MRVADLIGGEMKVEGWGKIKFEAGWMVGEVCDGWIVGVVCGWE